MRRSVLLLVCIALMLGAMLALSASAEARELTLGEAWLNNYDEVNNLRDGDEITIHRAVIPYDHSGEYGIWSDSAAGNFYVEDYEALDGEPEWSVEFVDGMELDCRLSYADGSDCQFGSDCWLRLDEGWRPQSEGVSRLRVNCDWAGRHTSVYVNVVYEEVELPIGTTIPDEVDLRVNRSATLDWRYSDGYVYQGKFVQQFRIDDSEDEFDAHFDWMDNGDGTVTIKPKSNAAGCYLVQVRNFDGNICTDKYVLFRVANSSGKVPEPEIELGYPEHVTRVCGQDDGSEDTIYAHKYLFGVEVINYDLLKAVYGGEPVFLSDADDDTGYFCFPDEYNPRCYHFGAKESYMSATTFTVHYNVYWADKSAAGETEVQYVRKTLPTGHTLPDELHFTVGETQVVNAHFKPTSFKVAGEGGSYNISVDTDYNWDQWDEDDEYTRHATFYQPGVYFANVSIELANVTVWKDILVYVADAEGNEPDVFPQLDKEAQDLEYLCAIGDVEGPVFIEGWMDSVYLENYDVVEHFYGSDPWWNFYPVDETDGDHAYFEVYEDNRGGSIKINTGNLPTSNHSADYVLALMMDDQALITRDIHIDFVKATMPTGIQVDREFDMAVGETIGITASFLPRNYRPNFEDGHINIGINDFPGDLDDHLQFNCDGKTAWVTAMQPGTYVCWIDMVDGNIIATTYETVVIRVRDEDGDVPTLTPFFWDDGYEMTMSVEPDNTEGYDYWVSQGDVLFIHPDNMEQLRGLYGDDWEWTFKTVEGSTVDMYAEWNGGDFDMKVANLNDMVPGTRSVVEATLRWGKGAVTVPIAIDFIRLSLPDEVHWETEIEMFAGGIYPAHVEVEPADWHEGFLWYDVVNYDWCFDRWHDDEDQYIFYIKSDRPGTYYGNCHIHTYNVFINGPDVTFRVLDENGQAGAPDLILDHSELEFTAAAMAAGEYEQGLWADEYIANFGIYHADWLRQDYPDVFTGNPVWTLEPIDGTEISAHFDDWSENGDMTSIGIFVDAVPTWSTESAYLVTCEWGGQSVSEVICIHYRDDLPMPEGINLPHAIVLHIGESFDWYGNFEPENYDFYERFYCEAWPHDDVDVEIDHYSNDHIQFIPRQSGVIWLHANVVASNIVYSKDIRLIVLEDGQELPVLTLPGGLREIGEEAFAGSDAYVVVVPDGCESIGSRAFADCQNLVEVQLPEGIAIAEDAFDGCPEIWLNWR